MPGYWRRPIARVYSYNLDLGETYYSPMRDYLEKERSVRGETPGALTYSERMARSWCGGEKVSTCRPFITKYDLRWVFRIGR